VSTVHFVLPGDIDDPTAPSGGNAYDRRVARGLADAGWSVREHAVRGAWPQPDGTARRALAGTLAALPDGALVLLDGLVASAVPAELAPHADRLRLVMLVHMPLGDVDVALRSDERQALGTAAAVLTTSRWSRRRLVELYGLPPERVHAAPPGVDTSTVAAGSATGGQLLCVAAVMPHKGHDLLVEALARVRDRGWRCTVVGSLDRDAAFVHRVRRAAREYGIAERIGFVGPCTPGELDARYAAADLVVLASRGETYGMVVTEALARGIPVLATAVKGLPEAVGRGRDGTVPGILVPPEDAAALAEALRRWLADPGLRDQLRASALARRTTLTGWATTVAQVCHALSTVATQESART
jgi:glycosyltransferase involved in cell wall biosynthesis